ncbi:MAG: YkgJ family cysteine cluster protein [Dehalococcoidia bacterium]
MSGAFDDLLARVVSRLAPVRVVTPEQYRTITCNRCGVCCEDIRSPNAPEALAAQLADPATDDDRRRFLSGLELVGEAPGGFRYRCRHFSRDAEGLGVCGIHETRPRICAGFPYGNVVRSWPQCAWFVQIRDADGTIIPALPFDGSPV